MARKKAKTADRVKNWSEYNRALMQRGSLTVWMSEGATERWRDRGPTQQGAQSMYSDFAIEACLRLRRVYSLALRQTQGFVTSLLRRSRSTSCWIPRG